MKKIQHFLIMILSGVLIANAQVPALLEYDGFLSGNLTGNFTMGVRLYNAQQNGTLLYRENIGVVKVNNGQFYFQYGQNGTSGNSTTAAQIGSVLTGSQNWLALTINGTEQVARERLLSVPFALRSADSQKIITDLTKTNSDLNNVVDAVGRLVTALGGNSSNLVSNPQGTISTVQNQLRDLLDMRSNFRVIALSGNLSFGSSTIGVPKNQTLKITNNGFSKLTVTGINYPLGFSGNWNEGTIGAGASQNITVTFNAAQAQSYGGNITVNSDATAGIGYIASSGTGTSTSMRLIALSGNLVFGNVTVGGNASRILAIKNNGNDNLNISGVTCPAGFTANWSGSISPGATQNVTVVFAPIAGQTYGGNLTVASNSTGGSAKIVVSGVGEVSLKSMITVQGGTLPQNSELAGQTISTFQIARCEVTWGEWLDVRNWAVSVGYTDLANVGQGNAVDNPVTNVSWYDVLKWCNAKSEKDGLTPVYQSSGVTYKTGQIAPTVNNSANGYRLPNENEWEWAARGGVNSKGYNYSGSDDVNAVAWYWENSAESTHVVGKKGINELSIYDMSGNVLEWCQDSVLSNYRRARGGSWYRSAGFATLAYRNSYYGPDYRYKDIGFRLARSSGL